MGKITTLTPEELAMVAKKPSEEAIEAVEKTGDQDALEKVKQLASMAAAKDLMVRGWVTEALSMLYKKCGPDPVREVWMNSFLPMFKADPDSFWNSSFHDRVLSCINGLRFSLDASVKVVDEDDEKLSFVMTPCASGQQLMESGIYNGTCVCCDADPITGGLNHFPIYCTHNPVADLARIEACGYLQNVTEFPENVATCSCTYVIYRRKEDIPEKYYTRLGLKKPD